MNSVPVVITELLIIAHLNGYEACLFPPVCGQSWIVECHKIVCIYCSFKHQQQP